MNKKTKPGKKVSASGKVKDPQELRKGLMLLHSYRNAGQVDLALSTCQQLQEQFPHAPEVRFEMASLCWQRGQLPEARRLFQEVVQMRPAQADAHANLAVVSWQLEGIKAAAPHFHEALRLDPDNLNARFNYAGILMQEGHCEEAIQQFARVLQLQPRMAQAWMYKGNAHFEYGEFQQAMECYNQVLVHAPSGGARIRLAAAIPMIPDSLAHIDEMRSGFLSGLQALKEEGIRVRDPVRENGYTNFFLAYHGRDDLPLQRSYAELYRAACPELTFEVPEKKSNADTRIRVGFISKYLKGHSIGKTSYGIIKHLDRSRFQVVVIFLGRPADAMAKQIHDAADEAVILPNDLARARTLVAQQQLDILFYQDIGMDPFTYFLAFSRLAPVQCTSFGHPVTSGIDTIDYYISTEYWEPEDGDQHYSESLVRLRGVASVAYYRKPMLPEVPRTRAHYGLPESDHVYLCPQNLFKFHPDFDHLLAAVLRRDPQGVVALIEGKHAPWAEILRRRFAQSIPDVAQRIHFVPRQGGEDYMNLLRVGDVMLDTMHFCGFNTTLEGFAAGLPVVTLPGDYMRSRHTAAFYRRMEYLECVARDAEDYVNMAVRLGSDTAYRKQVVQEIQQRLPVLWEEIEVVREFERFFEEAHHKAQLC